jgi:putative transposase
MHRTLKAETTRPPARDLRGQQRAFRAFCHTYNTERLHSALAGATPAAHYTASPRPYPDRLPPLEYPSHFTARRVTNAVTIRFRHELRFPANALEQYHVGLEEVENGVWSLYPGTVHTWSD